MPPDFTTADLVDAHEPRLASCALQLKNYGATPRFTGPIRTIRCHRDNALLKSILATPGHGAVLVIDGGGALESALVGDVIAALAASNVWSGLVINGAIRDSAALATLPIGIRALGTNPWKSSKTGAGEADIPITFGNAIFLPGHFLYADEDGILVSPDNLLGR